MKEINHMKLTCGEVETVNNKIFKTKTWQLKC
jgi:hypothetical protein